MIRIAWHLALVLLTLASTHMAIAQAVSPAAPVLPITIGWQKVQPKSISVLGIGGTRELHYDAATLSYSGMLALSSGLPTEQTLLINYDGESYPLILRLHPDMPAISFTVARETLPSCASPYVTQVEKIADNMDDAMRLMLTAAQMLRIPPANNCTKSRLARATRALFDRNVNLANYSGGLFGINPAVRAAYLKLAPDGSRQAIRALARADAYQQGADMAFAGQAYARMLPAMTSASTNQAGMMADTASLVIGASPAADPTSVDRADGNAGTPAAATAPIP